MSPTGPATAGGCGRSPCSAGRSQSAGEGSIPPAAGPQAGSRRTRPSTRTRGRPGFAAPELPPRPSLKYLCKQAKMRKRERGIALSQAQHELAASTALPAGRPLVWRWSPGPEVASNLPATKPHIATGCTVSLRRRPRADKPLRKVTSGYTLGRERRARQWHVGAQSPLRCNTGRRSSCISAPGSCAADTRNPRFGRAYDASSAAGCPQGYCGPVTTAGLRQS